MLSFNHNFSIRTRLLLAFTGLAVIPLLLAGLALAWHTRSTFLENAQLLQRERAQRYAFEFNNIIRDIEMEMKGVQRFRSFTSMDSAAQKIILEEIIASREMFEEIFLLDVTGREVDCVTNKHVECNSSAADHKEIKRGLRYCIGNHGVYYGQINFDAATGIPFIPVMVPLYDLRSGSMQGALFANAKLTRVWNSIGQIPLRAGEDIFIIDARNRIIAHGNPTTVLQGHTFTAGKNDPQLGGSNGSHIIAEEKITLGAQQFRVVVQQVISEALRSLYTNIIILAGLLLATLLGSFAIAGKMENLIFAPLAKLGRAANDFIQGNYSTRLPNTDGRELAELTHTFNSMADNLQKTLQDYEKEISRHRQTEKALRKSDKQIRSSLAEKEVLLKEIHHRVKNNLQIISSLLFLQTQKAVNKETVAALVDSQNRLHSMALTHEKLYHSNDLASIDMVGYLQSLAKHLQHSFAHGSASITFQVDAEHVFLPVDQAIPCGLIVNELVTNSLKHAFPAANRGKIAISFQRRREGYRLSVRDNGVGIPPDSGRTGTKSLGLTLVSSLVGQLDGSFQFFHENGTECRVCF